MHSLRSEFDKAGANIAIISAQEKGATEFVDAAWPKGDGIYIDESEAFKKALHDGQGVKYKLWWLMLPSVLFNMAAYVKRVGSGTSDVTDKATQILGGTFVVKDGKVVYTHQETSSFDNGDAKELLAAVLGKQVSDLGVASTPEQYEAVTCDASK